jgi:2-polyprenyl-6-methoxyphenol hydroxylase-like FAD-dependent oxidoreductase
LVTVNKNATIYLKTLAGNDYYCTHMSIIILGGGIAGLTTAIALKNIGLRPVVYEAAPEIKAVGAGLVLAANAIKAFQKLGIDKAVMAEGRLLDAFSIKDEKGRIITQTDSLAAGEKYGADNFTIHRANLHRVLRSYLHPTEVQTNKSCTGFERKSDKILLHFSDGSQALADYLLAADGIHSVVRQQLLPRSKTRYAGYTCWRAIIANPFQDLHENTETWGPAGRFGIAPLAQNKLYWFACVKAPQNDVRRQRYTVRDLLDTFGDYHDPIPEIIRHTKNEDLLWNDIADLAPLSRYAFGPILLIGDAAHATTPNLGQGACQAIEDAVILADEIEKARSLPEAFQAFEKRRMARTHYVVTQSRRLGMIAQLQNKYAGALRNALLRSLPAFIQQKQIEKILTVDFH